MGARRNGSPAIQGAASAMATSDDEQHGADEDRRVAADGGRGARQRRGDRAGMSSAVAVSVTGLST